MDISISIAGVDRTQNIRWSSFRIAYNVNQDVDRCDFAVLMPVPVAWVPAVGQEVLVFDGEDKIYAGTIQRVGKGLAASGLALFSIKCADHTVELEQYIVLKRYENETVSDIISDLITEDAGGGFTLSNVDGSQIISSIAFNNITVAQAIQRLAEHVGYSWYVDFERDIHFFDKTGETAPFSLTDEDGNYLYQSLELTDDLTQVRNIVTVRGGDYLSEEPRTELHSGDGASLQFPLINKFAKLPTVEVDSVPKTVGVEYLNPDSDYEVMWNFNEKYLRFTAGNAPTSGTKNISVTENVLVPIKIRVNAPESIAAYGERQFYVRDDSIESRAEAIKRAQAELNGYKNAIVEGSFRTYTSGLRPGQTISILSDKLAIDEDFVIQKVRLSMRGQQDGLWEVEFATLRTIGIIQFLQSQLSARSVKDGEDITLLPLVTLSAAAIVGDSFEGVSTTTPPYKYAPADPEDDEPTSNYGKYNLSTYADAV